MDQFGSGSQSIQRLNDIASKLSEFPINPDKLLKEYTSIYAESHHQSEQYFTVLCQHKFLIYLLENSTNLNDPTCVLQCLNMLLSNTNQPQELAYFLSQNAIHNYLFGSTVLEKGIDYIQYYIQLLKTIIMKISQHEQNKSLIRMFCNTKYPNFPLLTFTTILAGDFNELIKVTAQQCILILVSMINEKKIYSIYLSEPPMLVFVVRLATEFLKPETDHEGICKYFADLMYELRSNQVPLLLISNILCNIIIISSLPHKTLIALNFIQLFSKSIETRVLEHQGLLKKLNYSSYYAKKENEKQHTSCDNLIIICSTFYRILIKYMTNKFISGVYLSAYVQLSSLPSQSQLSFPLKVVYPDVQLQYKALEEYSLKKYIDEQQQTSNIDLGNQFFNQIESKMNDYGSTQQFLRIKQNFYKKNDNSSSKIHQNNNGFFGKFFYRTSNDPFYHHQYLKYVADFVSVAFVKGVPICLNLAKQIIPSNLPFISQYINIQAHIAKNLKYENIKTGQQTDSCQQDQIHFNSIRGNWNLKLPNIQIICNMTERFIEFINSGQHEITTIVIPKMYIPPCYLFLGQLKDYFATTIHQFVKNECKNTDNNSMPIINGLSKICIYLDVKPTESAFKSLAHQLININQSLQNYFFKNGYKDGVQFIKIKNNQSKFRKLKEAQNNLPNKSIEKRKNSSKIKIKDSKAIVNLCLFESINYIINSRMMPLSKYFETLWKKSFSKPSKYLSDLYEQTLESFKVIYFGKKNSTLSFVKLITPPTIQLRIELYNKKVFQIDFLELQYIKQNTIDNCLLQFSKGTQNVKGQSQKIADEIIKKFNQYKLKLEESIINALMEYMSQRGEWLTSKLKKMSNFSQNDQTPGQFM